MVLHNDEAKKAKLASRTRYREAEILAETWKCAKCSKIHTTKNNMIQHLRTHHRELSNSSFECSVCPETFNNKVTLEEHHRTVHAMDTARKTTVDESLGSTLGLECIYCGRKFWTQKKKNTHIDFRCPAREHEPYPARNSNTKILRDIEQIEEAMPTMDRIDKPVYQNMLTTLYQQLSGWQRQDDDGNPCLVSLRTTSLRLHHLGKGMKLNSSADYAMTKQANRKIYRQCRLQSGLLKATKVHIRA